MSNAIIILRKDRPGTRRYKTLALGSQSRIAQAIVYNPARGLASRKGHNSRKGLVFATKHGEKKSLGKSIPADDGTSLLRGTKKFSKLSTSRQGLEQPIFASIEIAWRDRNREKSYSKVLEYWTAHIDTAPGS